MSEAEDLMGTAICAFAHLHIICVAHVANKTTKKNKGK
jgi:hypothetical protein